MNADEIPSTPSLTGPPEKRSRFETWRRVVIVLALLYGFLLAIGLMSSAFKAMGSDTAGGLFGGIDNPFAALLVGILATVLVQSSSVTTSTIVALVASGELGLAMAVPMVMGANIGTTVTNTLVSIGSVRRSVEFKRAFACATVHDVFNILAVIVFLPLELMTGYLRTSATWLAGLIASDGGSVDATFKSPVKVAVKAGTEWVRSIIEGTGLEGMILELLVLAFAIALIFFCLVRITKTMRSLLVERIESSINRMLSRSGVIGILVGAVLTVAVQSSSITTSMLVPLAGAGILSLRNAYPIVLGCNLGTTGTALLASLAAAGEPAGAAALAIAFVHLFFNLSGTFLFYAVPGVRDIPAVLAIRLADMATNNKLWLLAYGVILFVLVPAVGIFLFK
ncbi:MAG: Na/Pi symporter [Planctomycetota bacterium]